MKKTLSFLCTLVVSLATFAQTNLTSGRVVVPLGGLKSYNNGTVDFTVSNEDLQKITADGNTANVYLFPEGGYDTEENRATGIQGFYIDLGATKAIGAIKSTWEGADAGGDIYVTDNEPAADGTLTGATLIGTFTNAQEPAKDIAVSVANSGRYVVFVPTEATNYTWGVKIRTFVALEKETSVLTSLEVTPAMVRVGEATEMKFVAKDQLGIEITEGVSYTVANATWDGTTLTADNAGEITVTATCNGISISKTISAINVSAPVTNPTEPEDLVANVIAVYSAKYEKGLVDNNPVWGVGGGAPNPLYSSLEEVEIADGHKVVHVVGTGFNNRTQGGVGVTNNYNTIHVAVYPYTATEAKIFGDNAYATAVSVPVVPGQWNYIEVENNVNYPNYILIELVGESEFYLDHFYFAKQAIDDEEAPVLNVAELASAGIGSVILNLNATDDKAEQVTYVITDQDQKVYTVKGKSGKEITYAIGGLEFGKDYVFTVVAKDDNENASEAKVVNATTLALVAAPAPDKEAYKVKSLYSNQYAAATAYHYGEWGQSTVVESETVDGNEMLKLTRFNYLGFEFEGVNIDLSDMEYVHIDVLPSQMMDLRITPIMNGGTPVELPASVGALKAGQWNSCDVKLADLGLDYENYQAFQLKIDNGTGSDIVYVDNIYFWKGEGTEPEPIETIAIPAEPTADAANVLVVYSSKYGKEELTVSNPVWGGYKDATGDDLYESFKYDELTAEGGVKHKVVHVKGTGINSRTLEDVSAAGYNKFHAAIYPTTATSAVIFKDNGYADRVSVTELIPGQWNYIEKSVDFDNNYVTIALDGETEFYVDHVYFEKVLDTQAPVVTEFTVAAGYAGAVAKAVATDDNEGAISYTFTLGETVKETTAASGKAVEVAFDGLELSKTYTVTVIAKDAAGNVSEEKTVEFTTMALPEIVAAPAPVADAAHVQGIYTDSYETPAGIQFMNWHGVDVDAEEVVASDNAEDKFFRIYTKQGFNYYGMQLDKVYNLFTFKTIHLSIWSNTAATIGFSPVNQSSEPHTAKKELVLVEGWNQFDISVEDYRDMDVTSVDQLEFFDAPADIVVAIDNIYFESDNAVSVINAKADERQSHADGVVFDLSGRRVAQPTKGIYIINGKKVILK